MKLLQTLLILIYGIIMAIAGFVLCCKIEVEVDMHKALHKAKIEGGE